MEEERTTRGKMKSANGGTDRTEEGMKTVNEGK